MFQPSSGQEISREGLWDLFDSIDPKPTSLLACPGCRPIKLRYYHLLATPQAARTCAHDLASGVARHDVAAAFRTTISGARRREIILRPDIGADHVMKHREHPQPFGAACRARRLIPFNLHAVALCVVSAAAYSVEPEDTDQHVGDPGRKLAVMHVNVDGRVQRRRRRARVEADAGDLRRRAVAR